MTRGRLWFAVAALVVMAGALYGQQRPLTNPAEQLRSTYVMGPTDVVLVRVPEVEEINDKQYRVDGDGFITLPIIGKVRATGVTVQQFELEVIEALKKYVRNPQVNVSVVQFRSDPVFFVGAFKAPGIYPLQGKRMLSEMLSSIGGLAPNSSKRLRLTRRKESGKIPIAGAVEDQQRNTSSVEINMGVRDNITPAEDLRLEPYDIVAVERAELIFINGAVGKVGGFELGDRESISVMQALTMAGGLGPNAQPDKAKILRPVLDTARRAEIPVDIKKIMAGQANDFPLMPNDVLFVPGSNQRTFWKTVATVAAPTAITSLIWVALR